MPINYIICPDRRLVISTMTGTSTDEELLHAQQQLFAEAAFDPQMDHLIDVSQAQDLEISADALRAMGQRSKWSPQARQAIVAPDDLAFGLSRMAQSLREHSDAPTTLGVFRSLEEALDWLRQRR